MQADFKNEFTYKKFLESGKEGEFDALFDSAVERTRKNVLGKKYPMYINGKETYANEELVQYSPIDRAVMGRFQKGTREHAKQAIEAAQSAFDNWSDTGYKERAAVFQKAADIFSERKFDISAILSIENGKSRYESVGEVDEAIDFLRYYAIDLVKNKGYVRRMSLQASTVKVKAGFQGAPGREEKVGIAMRAYGVFGVIAPFNFPVSISVGMSTGALITGNTVIFKPSSTDNMTMLTGHEIYRVFRDAGVPAGVFNYVTGPGSEVGDELVVNPKVSGIAFTGSKNAGIGMIKKTYDMGLQKAFIVEMGGKNPVIVSKYANLDDAVSGIASAAFGYCGQKCSAASRAYVHESVKEEFVSKLVERVRGFRIGNPLSKDNYIGPLISNAALDRYKAAVQEARSSGRVIYGGNQADIGNGAYVEPTIVEAQHSNRLFHEELFLPFLVIDSFKNFDDALAMANDVPYGLTAGLYSQKKSEINQFIKHIQAGVIYINRETSATTGAIVGLHTFVGWKSSGLTGKGTGSRFYLQQFMREQSQAVVK
ncbi:MAG: aldehyde dehydrogenase family protein [Candidatus Micrarchaeota archaeon]|nr:aldehyde dehydrogenase family protein [Candidatus Micrarchaeota archaeon]MDE1834615.1 aldehyde dehydrogenase family protein [Candidatus Micrarchaeota archaeon]MDE1859566.1 aldehyde dehydrogenase family protein [Candidatus Micrarchaeota archaeon]